MAERFVERYNEVDEQNIVEDYATQTIDELAADYDVAPSTMRKVLIRLGVERRPQGRRRTKNRTRSTNHWLHDRITPEMKTKGAEAYKTNGLSYVASMWGCSPTSARKVLKEMGIRMHTCAWRAKKKH